MSIKAGTRPQKTDPRTLALAARVLDLIGEEHAALEKGDTERLSTLSANKERAIGDFKAALNGFGSRGHDPALVALIEQAAAANAVNGQFAEARLGYTRARLGGLTQAARLARAAVDSAALYQADGFAGGFSGRRASYYGHV